MAATTRPGHLDLLRQDAKKQQNKNEPIMPYSYKILIQVATNPAYHVSARNFTVPGPLPNNNACTDTVLNCLAASQNGETNRAKPLARVSSNSPARERKADGSIIPVAKSASANITTSSAESPALPWRRPARGRKRARSINPVPL